MKTKNNLVWQWFDQGEIHEALLGEGRFFIPDELFGLHNGILIIDQLFDWAQERNKLESSASKFEEAVNFLCQENRVYDAFKLILSYSLILDERHECLPVNMEHIFKLLANLASKNGELLSQKTELRNLVLQVSKRFPQLAELLGISGSSA